MMEQKRPADSEQEIEQIINTAKTLGVEVDEDDVVQ